MVSWRQRWYKVDEDLGKDHAGARVLKTGMRQAWNVRDPGPLLLMASPRVVQDGHPKEKTIPEI